MMPLQCLDSQAIEPTRPNGIIGPRPTYLLPTIPKHHRASSDSRLASQLARDARPRATWFTLAQFESSVQPAGSSAREQGSGVSRCGVGCPPMGRLDRSGRLLSSLARRGGPINYCKTTRKRLQDASGSPLELISARGRKLNRTRGEGCGKNFARAPPAQAALWPRAHQETPCLDLALAPTVIAQTLAMC